MKLFCFHKWKILDKREITNYNNETVGFLYVLQCDKCGKLIKEVISA